MSTLAIHSEAPYAALIKPEPRVEVVGGPISIRPADLERGGDFMFIDDLQKKHGKMVGFFPRDWFKDNHVLIAEQTDTRSRLGYIVFKDKYMKREELGIVHQIAVVPCKHRGLIGASLVKAAFEHCPYGVRLFCCWVAQDLEANHFWESIGFVPIAFRTGSRGKANGGKRPEDRLQIFWQRRIREGDDGVGGTPYWYPTETSGGSVKENRLVLPIGPSKHWSDELLVVLPGAPTMENVGETKALEGDAPKKKRAATARQKPKPRPANTVARQGVRFGAIVEPKAEKPKREKRPKQKNDPRYIAAAREWRDRYLEEVNSGKFLPETWGAGKYDVSRQLADLRAGTEACTTQPPLAPLLLKAA